MILTHHVKRKMSQRGITKNMMNVVSLYGKYQRDKIFMNRQRIKLLLKKVDFYRRMQRGKNCNKMVLKNLNTLRKYILKIEDKGGITLVMVDGVSITTYNTNSFKRKRKGSSRVK
ncbi:MAG: hypothetical protein DSZ11_06575 [Sulfurovum sp.]|nr:MAG: hypothetical protein DSZ11_06575 [Sulfurovum sp.]